MKVGKIYDITANENSSNVNSSSGNKSSEKLCSRFWIVGRLSLLILWMEAQEEVNAKIDFAVVIYWTKILIRLLYGHTMKRYLLSRAFY
ncbi:MAG: hypothetical protein EHM20_05310 [Alphaproteobacteria bacterium]|nr:MAG: hypothetical protein EHM20_05310 [Alphaproteobacteria bacterium]